jgi:nucleotide-binding universal stress UspA family protein
MGSGEKESRINRILIPHDGSEYADKALFWALDIAEKYNAKAEVINVIPLSGLFSTSMHPLEAGAPLLEPSLQRSRESAHRMVTSVLEKARLSKPSVAISSKILEGKPAEKIVEAAKEGGFDLIVMGSRGLGAVKEFFLGSVTGRVANTATCPVVIVK